jgi:hypothetical protein
LQLQVYVAFYRLADRVEEGVVCGVGVAPAFIQSVGSDEGSIV